MPSSIFGADMRYVKRILGVVGGIAALLFILALFAGQQWCRAQIRPYLPPVIRSFVLGEDDYVVGEYLSGIDLSFERAMEDGSKCTERRDQRCLTEVWERLAEDIGEGIPVEASWMGGAHGELHAAAQALAEFHLRSETEPMTPLFAAEIDRAQERMTNALEEWVRQAER